MEYIKYIQLLYIVAVDVINRDLNEKYKQICKLLSLFICINLSNQYYTLGHCRCIS